LSQLPRKSAIPARSSTKRSSRPKLETLAETEALNAEFVQALTNRAPKIAAVVEACESDAPCNSPNCATCARSFRRGKIREVLAIAKANPGTHECATIYLATIPAGSLPAIDLKKVHDAFRKRLNRCGFNQSMLIGSTEAGWSSKDQIWVLHVHVLAVGVSTDAWAALEEKLADTDRKIPLKVQPLKDPERQISYNHKFVTYYRSYFGEGLSRALPLPHDRSPNWPYGGQSMISKISSSFTEREAEEAALFPRQFSSLTGARGAPTPKARLAPQKGKFRSVERSQRNLIR
jgi:hypothetical protein